jgi:hypothetical protein
MRMPVNLPTLAMLAALAAMSSACKKEPAPTPPPSPPPAAARVEVTGVELGRAIGPDKRVTAPAESFAPGDTIYAVVLTSGSASSATLTARFTYEDGQLVDESSQTIAPTGPAATEFQISKPDGWPPGDYRVEIRLDGAPAGSKVFSVKG